MKKLFSLLFIAVVLISCEGDQGPPGPQGPSLLGTVFEIQNVNFNPANNYSFLGFYYDYIPSNIEIYTSDVVLIYLNEGLVNGNDIWSLMPQTFYLDGGGIVEYNYNHTVQDFEIYLDGNGNLDALPPEFTQNQIFRIVILPADFAANGKVDISDYDAVVSALEMANPEFEVITLEK